MSATTAPTTDLAANKNHQRHAERENGVHGNLLRHESDFARPGIAALDSNKPKTRGSPQPGQHLSERFLIPKHWQLPHNTLARLTERKPEIFGVRRLDRRFSRWPTFAGAAQSGAATPGSTALTLKGSPDEFDGDKSPEESGDKSPHSKASPTPIRLDVLGASASAVTRF
jgi:hypothetical protein